MKFLFLLMIIISNAFGEGQVRCDVNALTNNCALFSPDGPMKIMMPDGKTFIPNLAAIGSARDQQSRDQRKRVREFQEKSDNLRSQNQFAIVNVLDEIPAKSMSAGFKANLLQAKDLWAAAFSDKPLPPDTKFLSPWPPQTTSGQITRVDPSTFRREILRSLSPTQIKKIRAIMAKNDQIDADATVLDAADKNPLGKEATEATPERKKRVEELVELARQSDIHGLVGDIPKSQWSQAQAAAVARIQTVTYKPGDLPSVVEAPDCQGLVPNAYYSDGDHSITICPSSYNLPDITLIQYLGHEIGHSADPCAAQQPVYKINLKMLKDGPSPEIKTDKDLMSLWKDIAKQANQGAVHTGMNINEDVVDPNSLAKFVRLGVIAQETPTPPPITQTSEGLSGYVLADVYSCLTSESGGSLRQQSQTQIEAMANDIVNRRKDLGEASYDAEADRKAIVSAYLKSPQCRPSPVNSQMREAIADWYSSQALKDYFKSHPPKSPLDRVATVSIFASSLCQERTKIKKLTGYQNASDTSKGVQPTLQEVNDPHPDDKKRIERIILANPELLAEMGCEKSKYAGCQHQTDGNQKPVGNTKSESTN